MGGGGGGGEGSGDSCRKRAFVLVSSLLKHSLLHFSMFTWFFAVPVSTNETFQTLKNDGLGKAEF